MKQLTKNFLHYCWRRRKMLDRMIHGTFNGVLWLYHALPLPVTARLVIKSMIFSGVERYILYTHRYSSWKETGHNLSILNVALKDNDVETSTGISAPKPVTPTDAQWAALSCSSGAAPVVDVIVPVYRGYDDTLACLYSALSSRNATPYALIVVNDASPEPALTEKLRELAARGLFELHENTDNDGFVVTVNLGMHLHPARDVVLLNSDTVVYHDWLDRLRATAMREEKTGTVTPLSNNAEICSYPYFIRDNPMKLEVDYAILDRLAAEANRHVSLPVPTAVGFCMYIKRALLDEIGMFDADTFGKGYGEENDFCLRAAKHGWTHKMACDIFVRHTGGSSFQGEKKKRVENALRILNSKHPGYAGQVAQFIHDYPVRGAHRTLDLARLRYLAADRAVLFISHRLGGGTERHILDMAEALKSSGVTVLVLRPNAYDHEVVEITSPHAGPTPNILFHLHTERAELHAALASLGIIHLHVHHLLGADRTLMDTIPEWAAMLGVAYDFTAHDYFSICPRINMIDGSDVFCGEPDVSVCERCVRRNGSHAGSVPVWHWRQHYQAFLEGARAVIVPNPDVSDRLRRYAPKARFLVRPHTENIAQLPALATPRMEGEPLRIAIIGAIGQHKGSQQLLACAKDARARKLPLHFHIIGTADIAAELANLPNVTLTGAYAEDEVYDLIRKAECHLAFFPSVWPETYCYTLSIAFIAGLYPVAFDMGAPSERIRAAGWGALLPLAALKDAAFTSDFLLAAPVTPRPSGLVLGDAAALYPRFFEDYYGDLPLPAAVRQSAA